MCPLCTCAQNTMHFGGTEVNTDKPAVDWENSDNCVCGFRYTYSFYNFTAA